MKRDDSRTVRCAFVAAIAMVMTACVPPLHPPSPPHPPGGAVVAHLTADLPDVRVERAGRSIPYFEGMELRSGDEIQTSAETFARIEFTDGNEVYVNHNTRVKVGTIRLFFGEIFNAIQRIAGGGSTTYTNDLTAASRATKYLVRKNPAETTVIVVQGTVLCSPPPGATWKAVSLTDNSQLTANIRDRFEPRLRPLDARREAQWVDVAARRLGRKPVLPREPIVPPPRRSIVPPPKGPQID